MAAHAPAQVEGDDARTALLRKLEYFPTPPWAARAGGELIKALDPEARWAWEPACGEGHMAHGLADYFDGVHASDIHDHGWPGQDWTLDFTAPMDADVTPLVDWVATNPPFGCAAEFVRLGLQRARRGVAILARAAFMESARRHPLFFGETPLSVYAPFFDRVPMTLGKWDPKASTATAYAWFVWFRPDVSRFAAPLVIAIPPGTKARLTRPSDAAFAAPAAAPLLDGHSTGGAG